MVTRTRSKSEACDTSTAQPAENDLPASMDYLDLAIRRNHSSQPAPIDKLLNIPELCQLVLDNLDATDLWHATQACSTLKANVESSPRLRVKLFLDPDLTQKKMVVSKGGRLQTGVRAQLSIARARAGWTDGVHEIMFYATHPALQLDPQPPWFKHLGMVQAAQQVVEKQWLEIATIDEHFFSLTAGHQPTEGDSAGSHASEDYEYRPTTLDHALLTQPPVKKVCLYPYTSQLWVGKHGSKVEVSNEAGVTFGDVMRAARAARAIDPGHAFPRSVEIGLYGGFVVCDAAREALERAGQFGIRATRFGARWGEVGLKYDPTRWVVKDGEWTLMEGGFVF